MKFIPIFDRRRIVYKLDFSVPPASSDRGGAGEDARGWPRPTTRRNASASSGSHSRPVHPSPT